MATYTQRLNVVSGAWVDSTQGSLNIHGQTSYTIDYSGLPYGEKYYLLMFADVPENLRKKQLIGGGLHIYVSAPNDESQIWSAYLLKPFDEDTVTYSTAGNLGTSDPPAYLYGSYTGWVTCTYGSASKAWLVLENGAHVFGARVWKNSENKYTFYSHLSSHVPYIEIQLTDYIITVSESNANPSSGFVDKKTDVDFSWTFRSVDTFDPVGQSSAKFRWRDAGQTEYTEIPIAGANQSITIPANTFTADNIEWQVVVTSDDGVEGNPSAWFGLTTVDSLSSAVAVSPKDVMIDGAEVNRFTWDHVIETGSPQSKYELQISSDAGITWTTIASESTALTYTDIPADILPAGQLMWRVRTYNSDGAAGTWSEAAYVTVRSAPVAPSITSTGTNARPLIQWQAVGQQGYELKILSGDTIICSTGATAGTAKQHRVQDYLQNGSYTVMLRIQNAYGLFSPWASAALQISQIEIAAPQASVYAIQNGALIQIQPAQTLVKYYILRDGVPIKKLSSTDTSWTDYAALGTHTYIVRGVDATDNFADSEPQVATVSVDYATFAPEDQLSGMIQMVYLRDGEPTMTTSLEPVGQSAFYAGRNLPVYDFYEYSNWPLSWNYSYRDKADLYKLYDLIQRRKTVRYRDHMGEAYWCVLTGIQASRDYISREFTLSAVAVDYQEKIEYDMED